MALLQQPIQRKLSSLLGAEVTFDKLNLSLLGGSIDASGVTVAGEDRAEPVLTIKRVLAKLAIKRALVGEIVVTSLTIERPVLHVRRRADGSTNLPRPIRTEIDPGEAPTIDEDRPPEDGDQAAAKGGWKFDVEQVLLVDGEASITCEMPDDAAAPYELAASPILAELKRRPGTDEYALTFIADAVGRRDRSAELGAVKMTGTLGNAADLTAFADASVDARVEVGEALHATVRVPTIGHRAAHLAAQGEVDLDRMLALLPDALRTLTGIPRSGRVQIDLTARFDPAEGLHVSECNVRATDLVIGS